MKNNGFGINPYNTCVTNKILNGEMMPVVWHVDDVKVSHNDPFEVTKFATYLSSIYRNKKFHRGKVHD